MPSLPTYLPVYTLPENTNPSTNDSIVIQASGDSGDVGLLPINSFLNKFADVLIDSTTITAFTNDGWVTPT